MSLHADIKAELTAALKAKEAVRLRTVRSILTAFTNELIATGGTPQDMLEDDAALAVIKRLAKQRRESITQYQAANRPELAEPEQAELDILNEYLPQLMSDEEILAVVKEKQTALNITDRAQLGQLIGAVMKALNGRADGAAVKRVVEAQFD